MKAAIEVSNLTVVFDRKSILGGISATIPAGKVVGLLGPSGAGKTTLIKAILGLVKTTEGEVTVLSRRAGTRELHTLVGYVTQSPSVYPDLTVAENMEYFATLLGSSDGQTQSIIEQVELVPQASQLVSELSGGQRARVSLAVALLGNPKILLLDEPTVGLDPVLRQKLWELFHRLAETGVTLLISSHVMDEADRCDELLFIRDGKLLATGSPKSILESTKAKTMEEAFLSLALGGAK